jgi:light-regulated signal transduction histidine kinase (bacteriophytochrome)
MRMRFQQFPSLRPPRDCETSFGGFYNVCFHNAIAPHIELCGRTGSSQDLYYVRDNGVGFDMQHPDKLFRPVQRLHNRDEFEETEVGLATVQRIIQHHGGRL